jgi:hypothetical protein
MLSMPLTGYEVSISMPIKICKLEDGSYSHWDNGLSTSPVTNWDTRICKAKWQLNKTDTDTLTALIKIGYNPSVNKRGENITLSLGSDPTGFFPAGPDFGDKGDFTVRILSINQTGLLESPYKWYETELTFSIITPPSYSLPSEISEGNFQIGSVSELRYPPQGFKPALLLNMNIFLSQTGSPSIVDGREASDTFETSFDMVCNQTKAAALTAFLTGINGRGLPMSIITPSNVEPFGEYNGNGTFVSKLTTQKLTIKHNSWDSFTFSGLAFWMQSKS